VRRTLPLHGRSEPTRASGPLPCAMRRPSVSVAPRRTVTADTARRSGAPQAAARPTTCGTVGKPGETPAMWRLSAAGPSARGGGGGAGAAGARRAPGAQPPHLGHQLLARHAVEVLVHTPSLLAVARGR